MKAFSMILALGASFSIASSQNSYGNEDTVENSSSIIKHSKNLEDKIPYDVALEFVRSKDYGIGSKLVLRVIAIDSGINLGIESAVLSRDEVPIETWENVRHIITTRTFYEFESEERTFSFKVEDYGGHIIKTPKITHYFKPKDFSN